jgi:hypothetical protein
MTRECPLATIEGPLHWQLRRIIRVILPLRWIAAMKNVISIIT